MRAPTRILWAIDIKFVHKCHLELVTQFAVYTAILSFHYSAEFPFRQLSWNNERSSAINHGFSPHSIILTKHHHHHYYYQIIKTKLIRNQARQVLFRYCSLPIEGNKDALDSLLGSFHAVQLYKQSKLLTKSHMDRMGGLFAQPFLYCVLGGFVPHKLMLWSNCFAHSDPLLSSWELQLKIFF